MKVFTILGDNVKQIVFTPETENEKQALRMISPDDEIHTVMKRGSFHDGDDVFGVDIYECKGGYYRAREDKDSVMFVIKPKEK